MSGIYIHIPFCKKRCYYCDFYSDIHLEQRRSVVNSISKELQLRKNYLPDALVKTIYFGGGTPSLLSKEDFEKIFDTIFENYTVDANAEITFEANPDDLTPEYLSSLSALPLNRLSIGIQSFDDDDLKRINRRHMASEALNAIRNAQVYGFDNISIDLIYGLPFQSLTDWEKQLEIALAQDIQHISAYGLTYEEGTVLWQLRNENKLEVVDEDTMNAMYHMLREKTREAGFEAYEISNFARPGFHSRHNSSYWQQIPYLGVGPSAHSYNGKSRQWNAPSIAEYVKGMEENAPAMEQEELSVYDKYNDFVMLSLRTSSGLNVHELEAQFGEKLKTYCLQNIKTFIETEKVSYIDGVIRLSTAGILISDLILSELMWV